MKEHHRFTKGMVTWLGFDEKNMDGILSFSARPIKMVLVLGGGDAHDHGQIWGSHRIQDDERWWHTGFHNDIHDLAAQRGRIVSVGILGEYISRIYQQSKMRPNSS